MRKGVYQGDLERCPLIYILTFYRTNKLLVLITLSTSNKQDGLVLLPYKSDLCGLRFSRTKSYNCGKIPHNEWSEMRLVCFFVSFLFTPKRK